MILDIRNLLLFKNTHTNSKIVDEALGGSADKFILKILSLLNLPDNYEWVVRSASGGFHIIFYAEDHLYPSKPNLTRAFCPNDNTYSEYSLFRFVEFRWSKHLVLPPSINKNGDNYKFYFCDYPLRFPLNISNSDIENLLNEICLDESWYETGKKGYNVINSDRWPLNAHYSEEEFIDLSPIFVNNPISTKDEIPNDWLKE
ncbi:hypothetical protein ES705_10935 [subsurface metagenome]